MTTAYVTPAPEHFGDLGRICFESFDSFHRGHNVVGDFSDAETAGGIVAMLATRPDVWPVAALQGGKPVGGNFCWKTDAVAGVGPIFVDRGVQGGGIGRSLMQQVIDHGMKNHGPQMRLVQDAVNLTSLSLYASLGFDVKEHLILCELKPAEGNDPTIRPITAADVDACDELCRKIYKISRRNELAMNVEMAVQIGTTPHLREREGRLVAYGLPGFFGHAVAETPEDLLAVLRQALKTATSPFGARWLCPARQTEMYRMAMKQGARALRTMNLMAMGPYEEPVGTWSPSILY